jgi:NAD(P)-dependent dehydrogenase (short-subunit alcohol dehydrogenase family)
MTGSPSFGSFREMFSLSGKRAIVTGGGGGIGAAIVHGFVELGAEVAIVDLNSEGMDSVRRELINKFGVEVLTITADVCNIAEVRSAVDQAIGRLGHVDILVNCHGIGQWVPSEEMEEKDWDKMVDVNLKGVFLMCQAVGRHMMRRGRGKIINIASMSGTVVNKPQPQAHYNASKAGVIMLTKSLAAEWARYNINVNSVSPGYTLTPLVENLLKNKPEYADYWKSLIPMGRFAKPSDIVGAVIFLASDASDYVTGHNLVVDGGYTIW